jgi:hypothetical protein
MSGNTKAMTPNNGITGDSAHVTIREKMTG